MVQDLRPALFSDAEKGKGNQWFCNEAVETAFSF